METIKIKLLRDTAILPTYGSSCAAGADLYAVRTETLLTQQTTKVPLGFSMEMPEGYVGLIYARSGLATKKGLRPANCVGVIDNDYRGEVIVPIFNDSDLSQIVEEGERIAQLIVVPYQQFAFEQSEELGVTNRDIGGFGSTGR